MIALILEQQKIFFPKCFIIALKYVIRYLIDQCSFINRRQELTIARLFNKPDILPPILDGVSIRNILINRNLRFRE